MRTEKFKNLFDFEKKSKVKAGEGLDKGNFPFFTSSSKLSKRLDKAQYYDDALVFGTGGSASVHFVDEPFSTSTDCIVAIAKIEELNTKFAYYYLFGNLHILERGFKGAGLKHISKKYIQELDIPIVPLETQNKIVDVLDRASSLVKKREQSIELLDELLRATFLDMFGENLDFKKSNTQLGDIASIVSGLTKGRKTKETELFEEPYLRVANAQDGFFDLSEIKTIKATKKEIERYQILKGDLLITEGGDPDKLGRGAVWELEEDKFIYQNHLYRIRINDSLIYSPYWLIYMIGSNYGKYYFLRQAKQTTGIATINKRQVSEFPVPNCSFERQKEFETKYLKIKSIKKWFDGNLVAVNELQNSITQKVFDGKLNFNIDFELDALVRAIDLEKKQNDLSKIVSDNSYLQRLVDKLNTQEFEEKKMYDKAKHAAFQLLKEDEKITQEYNEEKNNVKLVLK